MQFHYKYVKIVAKVMLHCVTSEATNWRVPASGRIVQFQSSLGFQTALVACPARNSS